MKMEMNMDALRKYHEAQLLGQPRREEAIQKVREGIACFDSLDAALLDAEENIERNTKSDFMVAHFYEVVKSEVLAMMTPNVEVSGRERPLCERSA